MIFGKNRAFLYPTKVLADTNNLFWLLIPNSRYKKQTFRLVMTLLTK